MAPDLTALVVDASVAVKWHLSDEEYDQEAKLLLERFADDQVEFFAPEQIRYEVPSAITAATVGRSPRLTQTQGREAIEEFLSIRLSLVGNDELILSAYSLVHQYGCSFYDAVYVALALQLDLPFLTADNKLHRLIKDLPKVVWIGDYQ